MPFGGHTGMACPSSRSPRVRTFTEHGPACPEAGRAQSDPSDQESARPRPRALPRRHRPDLGRRREGASQATPHRHAGVSSPQRRTRLPRVLRPGATLHLRTTPDAARDLHPAWAISRASVSKPISAISTSISPTAGGSFRSWSPPGPTPTLPSFWRCPSSAPRRSWPAWSPPSSSSAASPRKSGGTTPRPSPL